MIKLTNEEVKKYAKENKMFAIARNNKIYSKDHEIIFHLYEKSKPYKNEFIGKFGEYYLIGKDIIKSINNGMVVYFKLVNE